MKLSVPVWNWEVMSPNGDERMVVCDWCGKVVPDREMVTCHTIHDPEAGPCERKFCSHEHHEDHLNDMEGSE